jgi:lysophospholipase L1-like esterase
LRARRGVSAKLLILASSLVLVLVLLEVGLRITGYSFSLRPESIEFGWPDPEIIYDWFSADDDLFWVHKEYQRELHPPGGVGPTLVLMGDSCTELGNYDRFLARMMSERSPTWRESFIKVAVAGWSSYQGLQQLERDIVPLAPRMVTILFGWNDHWKGFGIADKDIPRTPGPLARSRLVQLFTQARVSGTAITRVSPQDYQANLRAMVELARRHHIVPILLTSPAAHVEGEEPEHLRERHLPELERLVPIHREYNEIVRLVARQEDAVLCDIAAEFEKHPVLELQARYFWDDGIHMNQPGNRLFAEHLFACFERHELLELLDF